MVNNKNGDNLKLQSLNTNMLNTMFVPKYLDSDCSNRPVASFKELMLWSNENFAFKILKGISSESDVVNVIHNKICIDENFILFAQENKLKISCLYRDAVVSWKEDDVLEKFLIQGVFHIKGKGFDFIHSALFHKGCNNEDEVSFFITCTSNNLDKYIEIRDSFDKWLHARDRDNDEIAVIGGDPIQYSRELSWDDLFLHENIKKDIISTVNVFLNSKDWYHKNNISWKMGAFLWGPQGNGKTSIIKTIIANFDFKPVTMAPNGNTDDLIDTFNYAESQSPSLLFLEDLDSKVRNGQIDLSTLLNLIDGVSSKNGLFIVATANHPEYLPANLIDRPSRFDRKFEIPIPDANLTKKYLKKWFGTKIKSNYLNKITKTCIKEEFTFAYLKELYVASMYNCAAQKRKNVIQSDIDIALDRIIGERINTEDNDLIDINSYLERDEVS